MSSITPSSTSPPEVLAYFNPRFQAYIDGLPESGQEKAELAVLLRAPFTCPGSPSIHPGAAPGVSADIVISLCPNLETLYTDAGSFERFALCTPRSMMRLQTLVVRRHPGYITYRTFCLTDLERLFRAAPNITSMVLRDMTRCPHLGLTLDRLTSLDLKESILNNDDLANLFSMCPNLETFSYDARYPGSSFWPSHFTLPQAQNAVLARTPKLKFLRLSGASSVHDVHGNAHEWDHDYAPEMKRMLAERGIVFEYLLAHW
jgi:hypothetical protein